MDYYFAQNDQQKGPFPRESLLGQGLKSDSLVWREGMADWVRADSVADLRDLFAAPPAANPYSPAPPAAPPPAPPPGAYVPAPTYGAPSYGAPSPGPAYPPPGNPPGATGPSLPYGGYIAPGGSPPNSGMAVASMILGILSLPSTCFYLGGAVFAILAVILGHIARGQCRRGQASGEGMALAGLICGYIQLSIVALFVILLICGMSVAAFSHH